MSSILANHVATVSIETINFVCNMLKIIKVETITGRPVEVASRAVRPNPSMQIGITFKSASGNTFIS